MMSRRRLLLSGSVDVTKLVFSATASYTDSIVQIGGLQYRLLAFPSSCTLTLDAKMLNKIPYDAWVVAGGGRSGEGYAGSYHSVCGTSPSAGFSVLGGTYHGCSVGCDIVTGTIYGGAEGGDGGWNQLSNHLPTIRALVIDSGDGSNSITENGTALLSATAGGNASGSTAGTDQTRTGTSWFSLPSDTNGAGASGGGSTTDTACATHGVGYDSAPSGSAGKPGIVYIRIPLKY